MTLYWGWTLPGFETKMDAQAYIVSYTFETLNSVKSEHYKNNEHHDLTEHNPNPNRFNRDICKLASLDSCLYSLWSAGGRVKCNVFYVKFTVYRIHFLCNVKYVCRLWHFKKSFLEGTTDIQTHRHCKGGASLQLSWTTNPNPCALTLFFFKLNAPYFGSKEVWGYIWICMRQISLKVLAFYQNS